MNQLSNISSIHKLSELANDHPLVHYMKKRGVSTESLCSVLGCDHFLSCYHELRTVYPGVDVKRFSWPERSQSGLPGTQSLESLDLGANEIIEQYEFHKPYLLFPFASADTTCSRLCARRIGHSTDLKTRFVDIFINSDEKNVVPVYNFHQLDHSQTIFACEGIIDSLMVNNGFSFHGLHYLPQLLNDESFRSIKKEQIVFVIDNELHDDMCGVAYQEVLKRGYRAYLWQADSPFKDLVELQRKYEDKNTLAEILERYAITQSNINKLTYLIMRAKAARKLKILMS